ncbi:hypothetical protein GOBAR_AA02872 [Gossypium barbadense]|uniref:Uncharacterized protein n=1 Tax=Gossypium barbadense TaxID=3634 RepID=A0A2P5YQ34_GOSBA|nr:hypothetical protein GOBAR_AA02872 [Gossypium barbadense]
MVVGGGLKCNGGGRGRSVGEATVARERWKGSVGWRGDGGERGGLDGRGVRLLVAKERGKVWKGKKGRRSIEAMVLVWSVLGTQLWGLRGAAVKARGL